MEVWALSHRIKHRIVPGSRERLNMVRAAFPTTLNLGLICSFFFNCGNITKNLPF